ncbi:MAG: LacI family DNA-binding transcriptional regulator [Lachnospira sp.]|nr:LacI family DNA-binding transcriptional regulator [Lachnospira sp.]
MSIKKIAEITGTSPATVSRVLNNPSYKCAVPGLRDKIWRAAMDLNYTPNEAARALKKGAKHKDTRHFLIEILITRVDGIHSDPYFEEQLRAVETQIHRNACILSKVWYQPVFSDDSKCDKASVEPLVRQMSADSTEPADGLIIIGRCNPLVIRLLQKSYKNIVAINRNSANYAIDEVICDGKKIAAMAVSHLVSLGHEKIAYVGKCHQEARYQGYCEVLRKNALDFYPEYVIETHQTEKEGFQTMQKFLKLKEPPTGIYCANDITAIGMLKCLNRYSSILYRPSIISCDDIEEGQFIKPMLSTVQLPKENMARFALFVLLDRIRGGHKEVIRIELEAKLLLRSSCCRVEDVSQPEYYI